MNSPPKLRKNHENRPPGGRKTRPLSGREKAPFLGFGAAVLIVEQKVREVLKIAHRVYVLRNGSVSFTGPAEALRTDEAKLKEVYL